MVEWWKEKKGEEEWLSEGVKRGIAVEWRKIVVSILFEFS